MKYMVYHVGMFSPVGFDAWSDQHAIEWAIEDAKRHNLMVKKIKNFITCEIVYVMPDGKEVIAC